MIPALLLASITMVCVIGAIIALVVLRKNKPDHEHLWEPWTHYSKDETYSKVTILQSRTCTFCGLVEYKKDTFYIR